MLHLGFSPIASEPGRSPGSKHVHPLSWLAHIYAVWLALQVVLVPSRLQQIKPVCPLSNSNPKYQLPCYSLVLQHTPAMLPDPLVWVASTLVQVSNSVVWNYTWLWNLRHCNRWGCPWHVLWKPERQPPVSSLYLCPSTSALSDNVWWLSPPNQPCPLWENYLTLMCLVRLDLFFFLYVIKLCVTD